MASGGSSSHRRKQKEDPPDVKLSKSLSWICRHGAAKAGIKMDEGGFIDVEELLQLQQFKGFSLTDIQRVVSNCSKQRFYLKQDPSTHKTYVRANQGHTLEVNALDLQPITSAAEAPVVVHGTYKKAWDSIKHQVVRVCVCVGRIVYLAVHQGLSRMKRNHIHFAPDVPGGQEIISGMRHNCQILIFIDMEKALKGKIY